MKVIILALLSGCVSFRGYHADEWAKHGECLVQCIHEFGDNTTALSDGYDCVCGLKDGPIKRIRKPNPKVVNYVL